MLLLHTFDKVNKWEHGGLVNKVFKPGALGFETLWHGVCVRARHMNSA